MSDDVPRQGYPDRIKPFRPGEVLGARRMNQLARGVNQLRGGVAPPRDVSEAAAVAVPTILRQLRVVEVRGDYVVCKPVDGESINLATEDERVNVAKPYLLRRSPFENVSRDGITYTYTSDTERTGTDDTDSDLTEQQEVVPEYVVDDVIYAAQPIAGSTGVVITNSTGTKIPVDWLDLNVDGRVWSAA